MCILAIVMTLIYFNYALNDSIISFNMPLESLFVLSKGL